jgi:C4-dicarboxylate-specific signal transduction histidine kinase
MFDSEKMASLGRMVAGFAHELNTPVGIAVDAASHVRELVRGFKRASIDLGSDACRDFRMAELIEDVLTSLHHAFKRAPVRIEVECEPDLKLHGPAGALEQILTNLLLNSRLHAFDEGRCAGAVRIAAARGENQVLLRYEDDGAGMGAAVAARVFEPFFSACHGRGGSGLGLRNSRPIKAPQNPPLTAPMAVS